MASAIERQLRSKCNRGFGKSMCSGCEQYFCNIHHNEHQEELAKEMDNVTQKHNELHSFLTVDNTDSEQSSLVRIKKWEETSIHRIHAVANEARTTLKQLLDQFKKEIKTSLSQVTEQLKLSCTSETTPKSN
jgi:hypothetical protein